MKLEQTQVKSLTSDDFKKIAFTVDPKTAQLFFRDKMYTADGRLRVMAQEYMANARDAHREIGKSDTPIEVSLPSNLAPEYVVRDYGPGISPERIETVFRVYGKSTKDGSNIENGGFGLGAKCAFSYCNAFALTTIHEGTKYTYSGYIDDSALNQLVLIHTGATTEPSGTEIKIPIKAEDIQRFCKWVHEVTHYWAPRPVFIGRADQYATRGAPVDSGTGWVIRADVSISYLDPRPGVWVLADDVPYRIPDEDVKSCGPITARVHEALRSCNLVLVLQFKVGDLTIYPNREILYYGDKTTRAIESRVEAAHNEYTKKFEDRLAAAKDISEAIDIWFSKDSLVKLSLKTHTHTFNGVDVARSFIPSEIGLEVYEADVEGRGGSGYAVRRWDAPRRLELWDLFRKDNYPTRRWFVLDESNGVLSETALRAAARTGGKGRVGFIRFTDAALVAAKTAVTPEILLAAGHRLLAKPPKPARVPAVKQAAVFLTSVTAELSLHGNVLLSRCRIRADFSSVAGRMFAYRATEKLPDGSLRDSVAFMGAAVSPEAYYVRTTMTALLLAGLRGRAAPRVTVTATTWEPRFAKYIPAGTQVRTADDTVKELRTAIMAATMPEMLKLLASGCHYTDIVAPPRWFFDEATSPNRLAHVVLALSGSTRFSAAFMGCAGAYMRLFTDGNEATRPRLTACPAVLDEILGAACVTKVNAAVAFAHSIGDEFMHLFTKVPEIPYLFEALAESSLTGQRGATTDLGAFVAGVIADKYVASLAFSSINDTKETSK